LNARQVDLRGVNPLVEIIVRAGDVSVPGARKSLQDAYTQRDEDNYPDIIGMSVVFRPGATLDQLAQQSNFPHRKLSFSVIGRITEELERVGYEPLLFATSTSDLPHHHSLAVARVGAMMSVEPTLSDVAADALISALTVVDNPYRRSKR